MIDLPPPEDDGLVMRNARPHVREKLRIVADYYAGFGTACSKRWDGWYCVDGLAGSGLNRIVEEHALVWGSGILALGARPKFASTILMDSDQTNIDALRKRAWHIGVREPTAYIERGDVNVDLLPLMREVIPRRHPTLVVLDPEGLHVHWRTIEQLAQFRKYKWKVELLILFPSVGLERAAGTLP